MNILLFAVSIWALLGADINKAQAALSPDAAMKLLYGVGSETYQDHQGYTYQVFKVEQSPPLQDLFDLIQGRILETSIGNSVCRDILQGNAQLLSHHLGMSNTAAEKAAQKCRNSSLSSSIVYDNLDEKPKKLTVQGDDRERRFIVIVTDRPELPLDSWTDAYTNMTALFLHNSSKTSDLSLRYLTQAIAHEMAIYFDAKSWPEGPGWSRIPSFSRLQLIGDPNGLTSIASLNPVVSNVLSFIRAYKVERSIVNEITSLGGLDDERALYPLEEFPFLQPSCTAECIFDFVRAQQQSLKIFQPALIALSPHYRVRRLNWIKLHKINLPSEAIEALEVFPNYYFGQLRQQLIALDLISGRIDTNEAKMASTLSQVMSNLIEEDLKSLQNGFIVDPQTQSKTPLILFLTNPYLSDTNIDLAAGPRPRIRSWGIR